MAAEPDQAEEQFGPYLVYERLGVGGMATVHRALERGIEGFERMVALKRLLPHLAEDASFIKSFVREAKLASQLNHVNIVQIFELGRVGTEYFISMEYIDGKDIRRILRHARKVTGPPPIHITVGMLLQLCDALDYAHNKVDEEGQPMMLVHRDVSPSNVLVTAAGHVKVIDFGIAKAQSSQLRTQTGRVKGKLAYMAPEAITGKELDARSDLFAVGVIAHELLTARPLFASKNEYQTLLKVQRGDIMPPSTFNQASPPELDAIVLRALARTPDERYTSASELRDELVALRKQYGLQTSYRDIAQWVEWAFSVEVPAHNFSGSFTIEPSSSIVSARTPANRAKSKDEEEAVEIAWGGGKEQEDEEGGPVVLDDVPDYSQPSYASQQARADEIQVEIDDDIPTPAPSHGGRAASHELPSQEAAALSFPPVRKRSQTEPGHTPAPPSNRTSSRMDAQSESGNRSLADLVLEGAEDSAAERAAAALGPTPNAMPPMPKGPTVRFKTPSIQPANRSNTTPPPVSRATPPQIPVQIPVDPIKVATKPGHAPARAATPTAAPVSALSDEAIAPTTPRLRPKTTINPPIGAAIAGREKPKRTWMIVAGILLAGAAATAVTLAITHGQDTVTAVAEDPQPRVAPRSVGTLKFNTEPADAEITIDGKKVHDGSPWATELEAGVHQVQIEHKDYKGWLTSIELDRAETQTLRVVLEPLGAATAEQDATLTLRTTPSGLEATLDGTVLSVKTPIKMPIRTGPHSIVLTENGVEVWRQDLDAKAATNYEFEPNLDAEHTRQRAERRPNASAYAASGRPEATVERPRAAEPEPRAPEADKPAAVLAPPPAPEKAEDKPAPPPAPPVKPPEKAKPEKAKPTNEPEPAPAWADEKVAPRPQVAKGPVMVAPNAVTKVSGMPPEVGKMKNADLPPVVSAKVCIDTSGKVTSADVLSKIERHAASDFEDAIRLWTYAPYKLSGVPTPACFALSFRVK